MDPWFERHARYQSVIQHDSSLQSAIVEALDRKRPCFSAGNSNTIYRIGSVSGLPLALRIRTGRYSLAWESEIDDMLEWHQQMPVLFAETYARKARVRHETDQGRTTPIAIGARWQNRFGLVVEDFTAGGALEVLSDERTYIRLSDGSTAFHDLDDDLDSDLQSLEEKAVLSHMGPSQVVRVGFPNA